MRMPIVNICPSADDMENELKKMLIDLDVYRYGYTQGRMDYENANEIVDFILELNEEYDDWIYVLNRDRGTIWFVEEIHIDGHTTSFDNYIYKKKENAIKHCKELWDKWLKIHQGHGKIEFTDDEDGGGHWTRGREEYIVGICGKTILDFNK